MQAYQGKEGLAMEICKAEAITSLINELQAYHALHDLQAAAIQSYIPLAEWVI